MAPCSSAPDPCDVAPRGVAPRGVAPHGAAPRGVAPRGVAPRGVPSCLQSAPALLPPASGGGGGGCSGGSAVPPGGAVLAERRPRSFLSSAAAAAARPRDGARAGCSTWAVLQQPATPARAPPASCGRSGHRISHRRSVLRSEMKQAVSTSFLGIFRNPAAPPRESR
ncbi:uncharacterized protein LOC105075598 isoform X12 [Camelus bactrianus]|uniref:Uncharacterized protein LOC105075598 isoform X12 n=1 Tax=Camelus bactrianus TaxID=9837 RepID=A0AC58QJQ5_CAMBA